MPQPPDPIQTRAALRRVETLAHWLDDRYRLPGTRFRIGLDGIVGLIPGVGDVITNSLTAYIIYEAWRLNIPASTLMRMVANFGIDSVVGVVPLVGDLFDIGFKANRRNLRLLHRHLSEQGALEPEPVAAPAPSRRRSF
jgi:Domain of unknown function (DUF4112)